MDKTVRLWHISRRECLCCFQHIDFVTALAFHPRNDQFFLSGSLDGKLRLWNIPDKKVTLWNEVDGNTKIITAANFIQVGRYSRRVCFISLCFCKLLSCEYYSPLFEMVNSPAHWDWKMGFVKMLVIVLLELRLLIFWLNYVNYIWTHPKKKCLSILSSKDSWRKDK